MLASELSALIRKFEDSREVFLGEPIEMTFYREGSSGWGKHVVRFQSNLQTKNLEGFAIARSSTPEVFKSVYVQATSKQQIDKILELSFDAGQAMTDTEKMKWGLLKIQNPDLVWLGFLLSVGRKNHAKLIETHTTYSDMAGHEDHDILTKPFLLSLKILKAMQASQAVLKPQTRDEKEAKMLEKITRAMLMLKDNPTLSNNVIAKAVGVSPATLSRNKMYQQAIKMYQGSKDDLRRGYRDPKTGNVESYSYDNEADNDFDNCNGSDDI